MKDALFTHFAIILTLGTLSQWLGWRYRFPAILLLLASGILLGPVSGIMDPDVAFGPFLFPIVNASVAVILFEGGLTLRIHELKKSGTVIFRLVTVGVVITWLATAIIAALALGFDPFLAMLFGALLTVTGPTVISPMLRTIRPKGHVKHIAKWEGILNDPTGVALALFVYEYFVFMHTGQAFEVVVRSIIQTVATALTFSTIQAGVFIYAIKKKLIPEYLHNLVLLTLVFVGFGVSNWIQEESGLLTVTAFGIILANQSVFEIDHVLHFKKNLQVLLISCLFIVLSARISPESIEYLNMSTVWFVIGLVVLVRPLAVIFSTLGAKLSWRERGLLMFLAPRGIVAAALTSVFALKLVEHGVPGSDELFAQMVFVIVGTVLFYGLFAGKVATWLGLSELNPQGLLIIGAHTWSRRLAATLTAEGISVYLVDTNRYNIGKAIDAGLNAYYGNILDEEFTEKLDLSDVGYAIAITRNHEINRFAHTALSESIDRMEIQVLSTYQVQGQGGNARQTNPLFAQSATFSEIKKLCEESNGFKVMEWGEADKMALVKEGFFKEILPLFVVNQRELGIFTEQTKPVLKEGMKLIYLPLPKLEEDVPAAARI